MLNAENEKIPNLSLGMTMNLKETSKMGIHGGPTGMVVANMAVHGPFFQPANVEGTGSHHSWL